LSGQPLRGFTNAYSNAYGNAHAYGHANSDSSGYSDSDGDVHTDAYTDANRGETVANAAAATNITAAAPLAGKLIATA